MSPNVSNEGRAEGQHCSMFDLISKFDFLLVHEHVTTEHHWRKLFLVFIGSVSTGRY